jgi:hypothetical protein
MIRIIVQTMMIPTHTQTAIAPEDEASEAVSGDLPCAAGLIAATLALMTTWAAPDAPSAQDHRLLLARKVVSNLFFLRHHPALGEPLRRVIGKVHERWTAIATAPAPEARRPLDLH